jgi:predicted NAD/FAD-dependent oxidoreductase
MRSIAEALAVGLDVRTQVRVERVEPGPGGVTVSWPGGEVTAVAAVVTAPIPQVVAMVPGDEGLDALARSITYDPCLAVMAELDRSSGLDDGHVAPSDGPIAWIGDNQHKGISAVPAVTIHSTPDFARAHLEEDPEEWVRVLTGAASSLLEAGIVAATGHRWRYSQPQSTLDTGFHAVPGAPIVVAGEAFGGARVEGAFLSGRAAGLAALELLAG